jgi:hypothetical protein
MNKTNTKSIIFFLETLAILALGIIAIPAQSYAYTSNCGEAGCNVSYYGDTTNQYYNQYPYNNYYQYQNINPTPVYNIYQPPTITPIVSYISTPNTPKTTVAKKATTGKIVASAKVTSSTKNGINTNNLTSNALFGSNGIYPSSLLQWIFLAILIIFIIILIRRIYGSREKYLASPLKHD